ncbi:MAG TPA: 5'-deoxynucleotidase [Pseudomonadales bacterium]|nr:5'-deoxynucleotidase [Pseudomonadales bacterium]
MSHFFAYLSKLRYIFRWGLKRNMRPENVMEHSLEVAHIAHGLAIICNRLFGGRFDPNEIAVLAMYHDASEVFTGDLPTPVKYFNPSIKDAYKNIESVAEERLLECLPSELRADYAPFLLSKNIDAEKKALIKCADLIAAYLKCLEEVNGGNAEFSVAKSRVEAQLAAIDRPEVKYFIKTFLPSYSLTLDELG